LCGTVNPTSHNDIQPHTAKETRYERAGGVDGKFKNFLKGVSAFLSTIGVFNAIAANPEIYANDYTENENEFRKMANVEMDFLKDLSLVLKEKGIPLQGERWSGPNSNSGIANFTTDLRFFETNNNILDIMRELKNRDDKYKDIKIYYGWGK
jgi:hypothetical protein